MWAWVSVSTDIKFGLNMNVWYRKNGPASGDRDVPFIVFTYSHQYLNSTDLTWMSNATRKKELITILPNRESWVGSNEEASASTPLSPYADIQPVSYLKTPLEWIPFHTSRVDQTPVQNQEEQISWQMLMLQLRRGEDKKPWFHHHHMIQELGTQMKCKMRITLTWDFPKKL